MANATCLQCDARFPVADDDRPRRCPRCGALVSLPTVDDLLPPAAIVSLEPPIEPAVERISLVTEPMVVLRGATVTGERTSAIARIMWCLLVFWIAVCLMGNVVMFGAAQSAPQEAVVASETCVLLIAGYIFCRAIDGVSRY